jgi:hypothetical protein
MAPPVLTPRRCCSADTLHRLCVAALTGLCLRACLHVLYAHRYLNYNRLSGSLPKSLGSLANLEMLCVFVMFVSTSVRECVDSRGPPPHTLCHYGVAVLRSVLTCVACVVCCARRYLDYNQLLPPQHTVLPPWRSCSADSLHRLCFVSAHVRSWDLSCFAYLALSTPTISRGRCPPPWRG